MKEFPIKASEFELNDPEQAAGNAFTITTQTFQFREGNTNSPPLFLDIHFCPKRSRKEFPAILFLHGGGMMLGNRHLDLGKETLTHRLIKEGYTVVSPDYRLAPDYRLSDSFADIQDACKWVYKHARHRFPTLAQKFIIMGESAGAYLSLLAGSRAVPKPMCVVSLWGYGDITGEWYTTPNEFFLSFPKVSKEEAFFNKGLDLYIYSRQTGTWPKIVTGIDSQSAILREFCPLFNVTKDYPPTFLLAGTADQDVPYFQSKLMAQALAEAGILHEFVTIPDGGHGWEASGVVATKESQIKLIQFLRRATVDLAK